MTLASPVGRIGALGRQGPLRGKSPAKPAARSGGRTYGNPAGSRGEAPDVRRSSMFAPAGGKARPGKSGAGRDEAGTQPDPMKTSFGYIGQDALQRQREQVGKRPPGPPKRRSGPR